MTYANPAVAEAAIEQFNNVELGGRPLHIRLDRKEVESSGGFPGEVTLTTQGRKGACVTYHSSPAQPDEAAWDMLGSSLAATPCLRALEP